MLDIYKSAFWLADSETEATLDIKHYNSGPFQCVLSIDYPHSYLLQALGHLLEVLKLFGIHLAVHQLHNDNGIALAINDDLQPLILISKQVTQDVLDEGCKEIDRV